MQVKAYITCKTLEAMKLRALLSNFYVMHLFAALCLLATLAWVLTITPFFIFFAVLSFLGATCGAFTRVIDKIEKK
jgi:hypothetical protein